MAVNLAYIMGAKCIVTFGLDMGFSAGLTHWHDEAIRTASEDVYKDTFSPRLESMVTELATRGVPVWRGTDPGPQYIPYAQDLRTIGI